jgi:23S rRNA U2552 (ribose-2'-O)-methylase RlmE/FtsJ
MTTSELDNYYKYEPATFTFEPAIRADDLCRICSEKRILSSYFSEVKSSSSITISQALKLAIKNNPAVNTDKNDKPKDQRTNTIQIGYRPHAPFKGIIYPNAYTQSEFIDLYNDIASDLFFDFSSAIRESPFSTPFVNPIVLGLLITARLHKVAHSIVPEQLVMSEFDNPFSVFLDRTIRQLPNFLRYDDQRSFLLKSGYREIYFSDVTVSFDFSFKGLWIYYSPELMDVIETFYDSQFDCRFLHFDRQAYFEQTHMQGTTLYHIQLMNGFKINVSGMQINVGILYMLEEMFEQERANKKMLSSVAVYRVYETPITYIPQLNGLEKAILTVANHLVNGAISGLPTDTHDDKRAWVVHIINFCNAHIDELTSQFTYRYQFEIERHVLRDSPYLIYPMAFTVVKATHDTSHYTISYNPPQTGDLTHYPLFESYTHYPSPGALTKLGITSFKWHSPLQGLVAWMDTSFNIAAGLPLGEDEEDPTPTSFPLTNSELEFFSYDAYFSQDSIRARRRAGRFYTPGPTGEIKDGELFEKYFSDWLDQLDLQTIRFMYAGYVESTTFVKRMDDYNKSLPIRKEQMEKEKNKIRKKFENLQRQAARIKDAPEPEMSEEDMDKLAAELVVNHVRADYVGFNPSFGRIQDIFDTATLASYDIIYSDMDQTSSTSQATMLTLLNQQYTACCKMLKKGGHLMFKLNYFCAESMDVFANAGYFFETYKLITVPGEKLNPEVYVAFKNYSHYAEPQLAFHCQYAPEAMGHAISITTRVRLADAVGNAQSLAEAYAKINSGEPGTIMMHAFSESQEEWNVTVDRISSIAASCVWPLKITSGINIFDSYQTAVMGVISTQSHYRHSLEERTGIINGELLRNQFRTKAVDQQFHLYRPAGFNAHSTLAARTIILDALDEYAATLELKTSQLAIIDAGCGPEGSFLGVPCKKYFGFDPKATELFSYVAQTQVPMGKAEIEPIAFQKAHPPNDMGDTRVAVFCLSFMAIVDSYGGDPNLALRRILSRCQDVFKVDTVIAQINVYDKDEENDLVKIVGNQITFKKTGYVESAFLRSEVFGSSLRDDFKQLYVTQYPYRSSEIYTMIDNFVGINPEFVPGISKMQQYQPTVIFDFKRFRDVMIEKIGQYGEPLILLIRRDVDLLLKVISNDGRILYTKHTKGTGPNYISEYVDSIKTKGDFLEYTLQFYKTGMLKVFVKEPAGWAEVYQVMIVPPAKKSRVEVNKDLPCKFTVNEPLRLDLFGYNGIEWYFEVRPPADYRPYTFEDRRGNELPRCSVSTVINPKTETPRSTAYLTLDIGMAGCDILIRDRTRDETVATYNVLFNDIDEQLDLLADKYEWFTPVLIDRDGKVIFDYATQLLEQGMSIRKFRTSSIHGHELLEISNVPVEAGLR